MGLCLRIVELAGATLAGFFLSACGRVEPEAGDALGCVPGAQVRCECARGQIGVQICADDATRFLECRCPPDDGSQTSGAAATSSGGSSSPSGGSNSGTGSDGSSGGTGPDGSSCMPACTPDAACANGECVPIGECPAELARCSAECVSLANSTRHCGSCGAACKTGESCVDGVCEIACAPETTLCDGECRPLATDYENCGACGAECHGREACLGGACDCRDGWLRCPEDCVDPMTDDENCGECGVVCPASESCIEGRCRVASVGWSTLGFDVHRRGVNAAENGVPVALAWAHSVTNAALNPVSVERGRVVVTARTRFEDIGPLWVLSAETGETLWSHDFGEVADVGQPSVVDGRIYVQHTRGVDRPEHAMLYCFDAASGDVVWSSVVGAQWPHYWAPAVGESVVYVNGGRYGGLYGFEKDTGRELFFYDDLEQYDEWAPTLVDDGVLSMTEGNLRFHDPESGDVEWTESIEWDWHGWSMLTVVPEFDDTAYVVAPPTLYAISLRTRATLWAATGGYQSFPAVNPDRVFVAGDGGLAALNRATGDVVWTFTVGRPIAYPPVATSRHVYVSSDDTLYAVDVATGTSAWQYALGGWPSIANGLLFVASKDGTLTAFTLAE